MTTVIKRNDTLQEVLKYWNHNEPSNIGLGRLSRKLNDKGIYVIYKTMGRKDLALFNVTTSTTINEEKIEDDNVQLSLEFSGVKYRNISNNGVKIYIRNWINSNKKEICIQLHYIKWFDNVEIKDLTLQETIKVLESYQYNQLEAEELFNNLTY